MTTYPKINHEPERLKIKIKDDEIKSSKYQTEKHDHENILKSIKIHNEFSKKKNESLNRKK